MIATILAAAALGWAAAATVVGIILGRAINRAEHPLPACTCVCEWSQDDFDDEFAGVLAASGLLLGGLS